MGLKDTSILDPCFHIYSNSERESSDQHHYYYHHHHLLRGYDKVAFGQHNYGVEDTKHYKDSGDVGYDARSYNDDNEEVFDRAVLGDSDCKGETVLFALSYRYPIICYCNLFILLLSFDDFYTQFDVFLMNSILDLMSFYFPNHPILFNHCHS